MTGRHPKSNWQAPGPCCCRGVLLSQDGRQALTASSDWTIKLWDLGLQRCIQTVAAHTDSVWALAANHDFSVVCSGGRDKCLYR